MRYRRIRNHALVLTFLLYGFESLVLPQNARFFSVNHTRANQSSELLITLKLTSSSGSWIYATQREGKTIEVEKGDSVYTFTPLKNNKEGVTVSVQVLVKALPGVLESKPGRSYKTLAEFARSVSPFVAEIWRVRRSDDVDPKTEPILANNLRDGSNCCIVCNGTRTCACAIQSDCGSCCTGECCT